MYSKTITSNIMLEEIFENGFSLPNGYSWDVKTVNGMREGKATVKNSLNLVHAVLFYSHDKLNGICSFYENGRLKEKRTYVDNVANGWACEYERMKEARWFIYKNGVIVEKFVKSEEMEGYWKEYDVNSNDPISICQYDENHKKDGRCYLFNGKSILKIAVFENGKEIITLKEFNQNQMTEYDTEGSIMYKGEYEDCLKKDYPRNGKGSEMQNNNCIYYGDWKNNKRDGHGCSYLNGLVYYEGDWSENVPDGEGILIDENGEVRYDGKWENGLFHIKENDWFDYVTNEIIQKNDDSKPLVLESVELEKMSIKNSEELKKVIDNEVLKRSIIEIVIEEGCGNEMKEELKICEFQVLEKLIVKKNSLKNVNQLIITRDNQLKRIEIENGQCWDNEKGTFYAAFESISSVEISSQ